MSASNGNGKSNSEGKSLAELAVQRRKEVRKRTDLIKIAKVLFDELSDLLFLDIFAIAFGVVRISKPYLAQKLGCSVATISRAQWALSPAELWTRTDWYEGHEITLWFIRGIAAPDLEFDRFTEGAFRQSRTKVVPRVKPDRNGHGKFCKHPETSPVTGGGATPAAASGEKPPFFGQIQQATAGMTVGPGHPCQLTPVIPAMASPSPVTVVNRQNEPSGHGRDDRAQRSSVTGATGHPHRGGPSTGDGGTPSPVTGYKDKDTGIGDKKPTAPPDAVAVTKFKQWVERQPPKLFDRELTAKKSRVLASLKATISEEDRQVAILKLGWLNSLLDEPDQHQKPATAAPAAKPKPAPMPVEQRKELWKKAKSEARL